MRERAGPCRSPRHVGQAEAATQPIEQPVLQPLPAADPGWYPAARLENAEEILEHGGIRGQLEHRAVDRGLVLAAEKVRAILDGAQAYDIAVDPQAPTGGHQRVAKPVGDERVAARPAMPDQMISRQGQCGVDQADAGRHPRRLVVDMQVDPVTGINE
ncbi:hypothetical protein [Mesorhizobium sp. 10J20-29]